jgi:hypothetical protein
MSDYTDKPPDHREKAFLSRATAGLALMHAAGIEAKPAAQAIVDGFDDNGLDAIYHDPNERLLYVVQSKWDSTGNGSMDSGEVQKFAQGVRDLVHPHFERFNAKVRAKELEINAALENSRTKCSLILAYTGSQALSSPQATIVGDLLQELNDTSDVATCQTLSQKELHSAITSMGESVDIEVMIYEWAKSEMPFAAYYGQVKAVDVAAW